MLYFGNGVKILPNVMTEDSSRPCLFITQDKYDFKRTADKPAWHSFKRDYDWLPETGEYPDLKSFLKAKKLTIGEFLTKAINRSILENNQNETINLYLNPDDYLKVWVLFMLRQTPNMNIETFYRLYRYLSAWFYLVFTTPIDGRLMAANENKNMEFFRIGSELSIEDFSKLADELRPSCKEVVLDGAPFEILLARYFAGDGNADLVRICKMMFYKEMRSTLTGLDFILKFKGKEKVLTKKQWNRLDDIIENYRNIDKYTRDEMLELNKHYLNEFDLGNEPETRFYPKEGWVEGLIKMETSGDARFYIIPVNEMLLNVNSYLVSDILKNKENREYISQFI